MQRNFSRSLQGTALLLLLLNWNCTKIDTTQLGADLLPAIDNVNTFEKIFTVFGSKGTHVDTTKLTRPDIHVLGSINNDPLFGKTEANIYFQLKPDFFPYYFGSSKDTINNSLAPGTGFDSVVLCLSYKGFYGDSSIDQRLSVYELSPNTLGFVDSVSYKLNFQPDQPLGDLLGQVTVKALDLDKYTFFRNGKDSIKNQIRIKLSNSFANKVFAIDSNKTKPFHSDSLFKELYKGFAVIAEKSFGGNGLFYISLIDTATRLEIHYRRKNGAAIDTAFSRFNLSVGSANISPSANANFLKRDTSVSEYLLDPDTTALYILSAPGTAIDLSIPALDTFSNSIIHRAELILEQVPGNFLSDKVLTAPSFLYADLIEPGTAKTYKPVFYDLNPNVAYDPNSAVSFFPSGGIDFSYYGGFMRTKMDPVSGRDISWYAFNLTRYVQNLVTKRGINYKLRVTAPYTLNYYGYTVPYNNRLAYGRIKIGNGNNRNYKLRMRIVYSKL